MKERFLKIASITMPLLLVVLAAWCLFSKDQHFPWIGSMIKKAERQQADLKKKIRQQQQLIAAREPAAQELSNIRANSFSSTDDITGLLRGRVERTFNTSGASVRSIATPRKLKGVAGIDLYEISLTAEAKTGEFILVLQEFSKPPHLLLRSLSARPNNMLKPEFLNLNLTITVAGFTEQQSGKTKQNE